MPQLPSGTRFGFAAEAGIEDTWEEEALAAAEARGEREAIEAAISAQRGEIGQMQQEGGNVLGLAGGYLNLGLQQARLATLGMPVVEQLGDVLNLATSAPRGVAQGVRSAGHAVGTATTAAGITPLEDLEEFERQQRLTEAREETLRPGVSGRIGRGATRTLTEIASMGAAGRVGGAIGRALRFSPRAVAGLQAAFGVAPIAAGGAEQQAREAGLAGADKLRFVLESTGIEAGFSALFPQGAERALGAMPRFRGVLADRLRGAVGRRLGGAAEETVEELATELTQGLHAWVRLPQNQGRPFGEVWQEFLDQAPEVAGTAALAGGIGGRAPAAAPEAPATPVETPVEPVTPEEQSDAIAVPETAPAAQAEAVQAPTEAPAAPAVPNPADTDVAVSPPAPTETPAVALEGVTPAADFGQRAVVQQEDVQRAFGAETSVEVTDQGYRATMPSGRQVDIVMAERIRPTEAELMQQAEVLGMSKRAVRRAAERGDFDAVGVATATPVIDGVEVPIMGVIALDAGRADARTLRHELYHLADRLGLLTEDERAMFDRFATVEGAPTIRDPQTGRVVYDGTRALLRAERRAREEDTPEAMQALESARAEARARGTELLTDPAARRPQWLQRLFDWFQRLVGRDRYNRMRDLLASDELWQRQPAQRGTPGPTVPRGTVAGEGAQAPTGPPAIAEEAAVAPAIEPPPPAAEDTGPELPPLPPAPEDTGPELPPQPAPEDTGPELPPPPPARPRLRIAGQKGAQPRATDEAGRALLERQQAIERVKALRKERRRARSEARREERAAARLQTEQEQLTADIAAARQQRDEARAATAQTAAAADEIIAEAEQAKPAATREERIARARQRVEQRQQAQQPAPEDAGPDLSDQVREFIRRRRDFAFRLIPTREIDAQPVRVTTEQARDLRRTMAEIRQRQREIDDTPTRRITNPATQMGVPAHMQALDTPADDPQGLYRTGEDTQRHIGGDATPLGSMGRDFALKRVKWEVPIDAERFDSVGKRLAKEVELLEALFGPMPTAKVVTYGRGKDAETFRTAPAADVGAYLYANRSLFADILDPDVPIADIAARSGIKATKAAAKRFAVAVQEMRENRGFVSDNGKAGAAFDLPIATCHPTKPCAECYAARAYNRWSAVKRHIRNYMHVMADPKGTARALAAEVNAIKRTKLPVFRLHGCGDLTSTEQVTLYNELARRLDRPIHVFSRHHDMLAKLRPSKTWFIKMGSVDADLYRHYGAKYLKENLEKRGIVNAWLHVSESDHQAMRDLADAGALPLVLSASESLHNALPAELQAASCPCDAGERTYVQSCLRCAMSNAGCHMALATKAVDRKTGKYYDIMDAPDDAVPVTQFLTGDDIADAWGTIAAQIIQKSRELVQLYRREYQKGNRKSVPLRDLRFDDVENTTDMRRVDEWLKRKNREKQAAKRGDYILPGGQIQPNVVGPRYEAQDQSEVAPPAIRVGETLPHRDFKLTPAQKAGETIRARRGVATVASDERVAAFLADQGPVPMEPGDSLTKWTRDYAERRLRNYVVNGKTAATPADHAWLMTIMSSPVVERAFWHASNDDGDIVASGVYSVGTIDGTSVPVGESLTKAADVAVERGATNFWFGHNHPTGLVEPSPADRAVAQRMAEDLRRYTQGAMRLHAIIVNGDRYSYRGPYQPEWTEHRLKKRTRARKRQGVTLPVARKANRPEIVADISSDIWSDVPSAQIIVVDSRMRVVGVRVSSAVPTSGDILEQIDAARGRHAFVTLDTALYDQALHDTTLATYRLNDYVQDVILIGKSAEEQPYTSLRAERRYLPGAPAPETEEDTVYNVVNDLSADAYQTARDFQMQGKRPDLANPGTTEGARTVIDLATAVMEERDVQAMRELDDIADELLREDFQGEVDRLLSDATAFSAVDVAVAQKIVNRFAVEASKTGMRSPETMQAAAALTVKYREMGTEQARAFAKRRDLLENPVDRGRRLMFEAVTLPPRQTRQRIARLRRKGDAASLAQADEVQRRYLETLQAKVLRPLKAAYGVDIADIPPRVLASRTEMARLFSLVEAMKSNIWSAVEEFYYISWLSSPTTHAVNIGGSMAHGLWMGTAERGVQILASQLPGFRADAERAFAGELRYGLTGMLRGAVEGVKNFFRTYTSEEPYFAKVMQESMAKGQQATRLDEHHGPVIGTLTARLAHRPWGKPINISERVAGRTLRGVSTTLMAAADDAMRTFFTHWQVAQFAYRVARNEGATGIDLSNRVAELTADIGSEAWDRAYDFALEALFQQPLDTTTFIDGIAAAVQKARDLQIPETDNAVLNQLAGFRPLIFTVPFTRTPWQVAKKMVKMSPFSALGTASDLATNVFAGRTNTGAALRLARTSLAGLMTLVVWSLLDDDDENEEGQMLTGTGGGWKSGSYVTREGVAPPTSINATRLFGIQGEDGGTVWMDYSRADPWGKPIAMIVDSTEWLMRQPPDASAEDIAIGSATVGAKSLADTMLDSTMLSGIRDFLTMWDQVGEGRDTFSSAKRWASRQGTVIIPNIVKQWVRAEENTLEETRVWASPDGSATFSRRWAEQTQVIADGPYAKRNIWGRVRTRYGDEPATGFWYNLIAPLRTRTNPPPDDPGYALDRLLVQVNADNPGNEWWPQRRDPWWGSGKERVEMTGEQYDALQRDGGALALGMAKGLPLSYGRPQIADREAIRKVLADGYAIIRARMKEGADTSIGADLERAVDSLLRSARASATLLEARGEKRPESLRLALEQLEGRRRSMRRLKKRGVLKPGVARAQWRVAESAFNQWAQKAALPDAASLVPAFLLHDAGPSS